MTWKDVVRQGLSRAGLEVRRVSQPSDLVTHLAELTERGVDLSNMYDIGAHRGDWTSEIVRKLPRVQQIVMFEPNTEHQASLLEVGQPLVPVLLGDSDRIVNFYALAGTGDSIFRENSGLYDNLQPRQVRMRPLDDVVTEMSLVQPNLIKIDAQGAELTILRGARRTLMNTSLIFLEMPLVNYNHGAPSISEYLTFVTGCGFVPVGLYEVHTSARLVVQVDMLFMSLSLYGELYGTENVVMAHRLLPNLPE